MLLRISYTPFFIAYSSLDSIYISNIKLVRCNNAHALLHTPPFFIAYSSLDSIYICNIKLVRCNNSRALLHTPPFFIAYSSLDWIYTPLSIFITWCTQPTWSQLQPSSKTTAQTHTSLWSSWPLRSPLCVAALRWRGQPPSLQITQICSESSNSFIHTVSPIQ